MTVYIDADAPGEAQEVKLYQHNILLSTGGVLSIVTKDSTPFTSDSFKDFLHNNNFVVSSTLDYSYCTAPSLASAGIVSFYVYSHLWEASDKIYSTRREATLTIADGALSLSPGVGSNKVITVNKDTVISI